ncbi:MAG: hypothetical protein E3J72_16765 [Planctomycetota bacterium]|nr:MAG: hypothetical protein E3J72_16765 [Planctomycetota bacterium]
MKHRILLIAIAVTIALMFAMPGCGSGGGKSSSSGGGSGGGTGTGSGTGGTGTGTGGNGGGGTSGTGEPPFGESSNGSGGGASGDFILVNASAASGGPTPLLIVYSGTEGSSAMASNLNGMLSSSIMAVVFDGRQYMSGDSGGDGAAALDQCREKYNIDNDRTYLLGESAGTGGARDLSMQRQSYFAAYWANDVEQPMSSWQAPKTAAELGFAPWGQIGPGGQPAAATDPIIQRMRDAGYRLDDPSPYAGPGCNQHGSFEQLQAALAWFVGKTRQ